GKSRVIAEIIVQATARGERVLLLGRSAEAIDGVLEQIGTCDSICALRCLGHDEEAADLARAVAALTFEARRQALTESARQAARRSVETAREQCERRQQQEPIYVQLREVAERRGRLEAEATLSAQADERRRAVDDVSRQLEAVDPLAEARLNRRWLTWAWWCALFRGDVLGQRDTLLSRREVIQRELQQFETEIDRLRQLDTQADGRTSETISPGEEWQQLLRQLDGSSPKPEGFAAEAVERAFEAWRDALRQNGAGWDSARQWSACVEQLSPSWAERLKRCVNVVAATTRTIATDPHFGDSGLPEKFDLLVLDESHRITESEFIALARRARRWVLLGEPAQDSGEIGGSVREWESESAGSRWRAPPPPPPPLPPPPTPPPTV